MRSALATLISLSLSLGPAGSYASAEAGSTAAHQGPSLEDLGAKAGQPGYIVDKNEIRLGEDQISLQTEMMVAHDEQSEKRATDWFRNQLDQADKSEIRYSITHTQVEGESNPIEDGRLALTEKQQSKVRPYNIAKTTWATLKKKTQNAADGVTRFFTKTEQRPRVTFALTRFLLNGGVMSYTFASDFFLGGIVPVEVAIAAGLAGGTLSGLLNYFSYKYSKWLDNPGQVFHAGDKLLKGLKTAFPMADDATHREIVKASKWMALEGVFFMIPVGVLAAFGYPMAPTVGLLAAKLMGTVVAGTISQYSWDAAITRFQNASEKILGAENRYALNVVNFKASLAFVVVSFLSVGVSTLSLGSEWWKSYTLLGAMGYAGHRVKKKIYAKMNERLALVRTLSIPQSSNSCGQIFRATENPGTANPVTVSYSIDLDKASGQ